MPLGVTIFPASAMTDNFADEARGLSIPCFDFWKGGGA